MITHEIFEKATGTKPIHDALDRCNCLDAGEAGHWNCGWCYKHNKPVFMCDCHYLKVIRVNVNTERGMNTVISGLKTKKTS